MNFKNYFLLSNIYETLLIAPVRRLYLLGPDLFGWNGKTKSQICTIITNTPEYIWDNNLQECDNLIEKKFTSIFVIMETVFYLLLLYQIFSSLTNYFFFYRPIINRLHRLLDESKK